MSRLFNGGVTRVARASVPAVDTGSWTMGAWVYPISGGPAEGGWIITFEKPGATERTLILYQIGLGLRVEQGYVGTIPRTIATTTLATGAWQVVLGTFDASDLKCRLYVGTLSTPVAELAYSAQPTAVGTRRTGATVLTVGNTTDAIRGWDGRISRPFLINRLLTLAEMEAFRLGEEPPSLAPTLFYWPFDSPMLHVEDLSGNGLNGTITGAALDEEPPLGDPAAEVLTVLRVPGGTQAVETDTANAGVVTRRVLGSRATETDTANAGASGNFDHTLWDSHVLWDSHLRWDGLIEAEDEETGTDTSGWGMVA